MVCKRCGTQNNPGSWRCKHCSGLLQDTHKTEQLTSAPIPSPIRQARKANLTVVEASFSEDLSDDPQFGQVKPAFDSKFRKVVFLTASVLTLITLSWSGYYLIGTTSREDKSELFAAAEQLYMNNDYLGARAAFQKFVTKYPKDKLGAIAAGRIEDISVVLRLQEQEKEKKIAVLLKKSKGAFDKQNYLYPNKNNVIEHTNQILQIDPTNGEAIKLQAMVITLYERKALAAQKKRRYRLARQYYQNILKIIPGDEITREKIMEVENLANK